MRLAHASSRSRNFCKPEANLSAIIFSVITNSSPIPRDFDMMFNPGAHPDKLLSFCLVSV
jgi:hypothetical protein